MIGQRQAYGSRERFIDVPKGWGRLRFNREGMGESDRRRVLLRSSHRRDYERVGCLTGMSEPRDSMSARTVDHAKVRAVRAAETVPLGDRSKPVA